MNVTTNPELKIRQHEAPA